MTEQQKTVRNDLFSFCFYLLSRVNVENQSKFYFFSQSA